jgi:hypothetical protein
MTMGPFVEIDELKQSPNNLAAIFLDGPYAPDSDGQGFMFYPAPAPA